MREYYDLIDSDECVPAGFAVNPNVAVVLPMMLHEDEATAIERGIDGAHFFGYSLAHYYGMGTHQPGRTNVWEEFQNRDTTGFARHIVQPDQSPLAVKIMQAGLGSLRGAIGTPDQVTDLLRRYEAAGVDQVIFVMQAGPNLHEHICESIELFGSRVAPLFAEGREERERDKAEALAGPVERALARRSPPRRGTARLRDRRAGRAGARRPSRASRPARSGRRLGRGGATRREGQTQEAIAKLVRGASDEQLERRFGSQIAQRAIFGGMARQFEPRFAVGFEGDIAYELAHAGNGAPPDRWTLRVKDGAAKALPGDDGSRRSRSSSRCRTSRASSPRRSIRWS